MNILILNGSPKGKYSTTLHTCLYLEKKFPQHTFSVLNAGQQIKSLEKDFSPALQSVSGADALLFSYPVYTFLLPSQLHRFIELLKVSGVDLTGKIATQVTTSKHFYDTTAHKFIEDNCADLGLKFIDGLSADMDDLLTEKGRRQAEDWFSLFLWNAERGYFKSPEAFLSEFVPVPATATDPVAKSDAKKAVIVADIAEDDTVLKGMVERFINVFPYGCDLVNIREYPFKGGCISCFNCSTDGTCIYKDGFSELLRNDIQTAEAIVLAFSIKDHSMGSVFKTYDDRQFCNGHRTVTMGKPFAYLVSGNLSEEENLRLVMDGRAEVGGNFLAGAASDESNPDGEIDAVAMRLNYAIEHAYVQPSNFLGVGGMKIFRDLIWLMQGMMKADHKFYKEHGQYDFPQKKRGRMMAMYLVGGLMGNEKLKTKMGSKMNEGMIMPYKKVLEKVGKKQ